MYIHLNFAVRGSRPGKNVQLTEGEIRGLCLKSREIFLSQPILLELEAPLKICGENNIWTECCTNNPTFYIGQMVILYRTFSKLVDPVGRPF